MNKKLSISLQDKKDMSEEERLEEQIREINERISKRAKELKYVENIIPELDYINKCPVSVKILFPSAKRQRRQELKIRLSMLYDFYSGVLQREKKYSANHDRMQEEVDNILLLADELEGMGRKAETKFLAELHSAVLPDYADVFPFSQVSLEKQEEYIQSLFALQNEVQEHIDRALKEKDILPLPFGAKDLDDFAIKANENKEEAANKKAELLSSTTARIKALKSGGSGSLFANLYSTGEEPIENKEANDDGNSSDTNEELPQGESKGE